MMSRATLLTAISLVCLGAVLTTHEAPPPESEMLNAAQAFLETLTPEQAQDAIMPFGDAERFTWYYTPTGRKGLPLKSMMPAQRDAALELLRTGFSEQGFNKAETIRQLEVVLFEMSGRAFRDPDLYFFTIFGEPSEGGTWGWRYEGHHVSQHWTIIDGTALATSPQFFGANPAEVREGSMRGTRVLEAEEEMARALLHSLTPSQRTQAIINDTAPSDILTTNDRQAALQPDEGVLYSALNREQQHALVALIEEYASAQPPQVAQARLQRLRAAGLEQVKFAWMGGTNKGHGHYYRIQGPTFLIEYDNTQNDANHIHCVWRDFDGDFGVDLLAAHRRAFPHHVD